VSWAKDRKDPYAAPVVASEALTALAQARSQEPSRRQRGAQSPESGFAKLPSGDRNNTVASLAGWARARGLDVDAVNRLLNGFNGAFFEEPLGADELLGVVSQAGQWEAGGQTIEIIMDDEPAEGEDRPAILKASRMTKPPPMPWLWKPWLPEGRLVLLVGDEGIGKGMFSAHCAVKAVSGEFGDPADVMWFSIEDDPEEDIYKRLLSAGYDSDRHQEVHFFNPDLPVGFPLNIPEVEKYIVANGIKLVIIDPGRSYLSGEEGVEKSFNNDVFVGTALRAINRMAARTGATVLFIHHTNKNADASRRHKSGGSAAFSQAARHRVDVAKAGTDEWAEWAMAVTKTNYGVEGFLTEYRLVADEENDTAKFEMGEPVHRHRTLDIWQKEREKELGEPEVDIADSDKLAFALDGATLRGSIVPNRDELIRLSRLPRSRIQAAVDELIEEGRIVQDGDTTRRKWLG
jgi:hypothetical protein